ncbi:hypothetical protein JCM10213_003785 [Rhodosporidiobolus nylandii]
MPSLLDLPVKLLEEVVQHLHAEAPRRYFGSVCKALLPLSRRLFFSQVSVVGWRRLGQFCAVVDEGNGVEALVNSLELDMAGEEDNREPKNRAVLDLFCRLRNVSVLSIKGSSRLAKAIIAPSRPPYPFPQLDELTIDDPLAGWSNPFSPHNLRLLDAYPELSHLELICDRPSSELGLKGHLTGNPAVVDLISALENLNNLIFIDLEPESNLSALLSAVAHPDEVWGMGICRAEAQSSEDLLPVLSDFPNLTHLDLGTRTYTPSLFPFLHGLSALECLSLGPFNPSLAIEDLKPLVAGPTRVVSLEFLTLYNVFEDDGWFGPVLRGFNSKFRRHGLKELVKLAEAAGIKMAGLAVEEVKED